MTEFDEITITLADGYPAYARIWLPEAPCLGGVLYLHGIQSHAGWYESSAKALRDAGFVVLQPDRRGSGRNHKQRGHAEDAQQLINDGFACVNVLAERCEQSRVHILGVSWGGKLAPAMHVSDPSRTRSLTLVTPGVFPIIDVTPAEKFRIGWSMVSSPERVFDIPLNDPTLFTDDPDWLDYLRNDELQLHQASAGFFLASRRMDRIVRRLPEAPAVPIHLLLAGDERIVDNEKTRTWVRQLNWQHRVISTYDRSRHTLEMGPDRDRYLDELVRWLCDPEAFVTA